MWLEHYHEVFQAQVEVMEELEITIKDEVLVKAVAQEYAREIPNANDWVDAITRLWLCNL